MIKFVTSGTAHLLLLIMRPEDLAQYRGKPLDDHSMLDGTEFGRPDAFVLITYARSGTQARRAIKTKFHREPTRNSAGGTLTFAAAHENRQVVGILLTEPDLARFEAQPLEHMETFEGERYGLPGFRVILTYADDDVKIVRFMRGLGIDLAQIAEDPTLRPLWESYRTEIVRISRDVARTVGRPFDFDIAMDDVRLADPTKDGMSETALLAVRGEEMAWFRANPTETEYMRRAKPGEFPPNLGATWIKVHKVSDDVRVRIPMKRINGQFVECRSTIEENCS